MFVIALFKILLGFETFRVISDRSRLDIFLSGTFFRYVDTDSNFSVTFLKIQIFATDIF